MLVGNKFFVTATCHVEHFTLEGDYGKPTFARGVSEYVLYLSRTLQVGW